jgi:phosphoglucomutase
MSLRELVGKPASRSFLANIPILVSAYYTHTPDVSDPDQRVAFGTSGHRESSLRDSFTERHILAICQAIAEYRKSRKIGGPLFMGMATHALSEAASGHPLEALIEVTKVYEASIKLIDTK